MSPKVACSNFIGNGSAVLMRKAAIQEAGGYDPSLRARSAEGCGGLAAVFSHSGSVSVRRGAGTSDRLPLSANKYVGECFENAKGVRRRRGRHVQNISPMVQRYSPQQSNLRDLLLHQRLEAEGPS